jgi:hypothetical protein
MGITQLSNESMSGTTTVIASGGWSAGYRLYMILMSMADEDTPMVQLLIPREQVAESNSGQVWSVSTAASSKKLRIYYSGDDLLVETVGYTGSGDLNRLTAIPRINELWLTKWPQRIFGMGLGNCDTSGFEFLNTPFHAQYSWLRYAYFSVSFIFLEMGFTGLAFYIGFFVLVWFMCGNAKHAELEDRMYIQISRIVSLCCPLIIIYNNSLRAEGAYLLYFTLALGFIGSRKLRTPLPKQRRLKQH